jgi:triosephosphate isomerase
MKQIFVNLKRFDVPRALGGVCPSDDPGDWIRRIVRESAERHVGDADGLEITYLLPEALIIPALQELGSMTPDRRSALAVGCQSVFRDEVKPGGNFGAFTSNLPAAAARNMGCTWSIIGHSEERRDKQGIIGAYAPEWNNAEDTRRQVMAAVGSLLSGQVMRALEQGMRVLFCIGETAEERGDGDFEEQKPRIESVLKEQLASGLKGIEAYPGKWEIVIGYEPVWAIGPGKTPPDRDYIAYVSGLIKGIGRELLGRELPVVYGGGLKRENAGMIAGIDTVDGGLVALTRFSDDIGFYMDEFIEILKEYAGGRP